MTKKSKKDISIPEHYHKIANDAGLTLEKDTGTNICIISDGTVISCCNTLDELSYYISGFNFGKRFMVQKIIHKQSEYFHKLAYEK